jgi:integrase
MPKGRISKRSVDALTCPQSKDRAFLWDEALAGFGVAAFPSGKKAYVVQFRQNGRSRRATIGEHGRLTPDEARTEAKKLLGAVAQGSDPIAERQKERGVWTFAAVADEFMRLHIQAKRKPRTAHKFGRILRLHILPAIGSKRITDVRRADVARLHSEMSDTPAQANKVPLIVSAIWSFAVKRDEVALADNPARGIERYREERRERLLSSEEMARLGDALAEAEPRFGPFAIAAVRLLVLTGARLREILHAKWEYVDIERGVIFLPDSKTGRKPVYLSAAALVVLAELPRLEGNPFIIPGERSGKPKADLGRPWAAVTRAAGLDGMRLHDLRHNFASVGAGASLGLPVIGKLLGHSQPATTHRYAHLDADPLRRAVETIGSTIDAAMRGENAGNVVALPRGKTR